MNSTTLYLVRHGDVLRPAGKSYIGQIEAPLSAQGIKQARALHKWLQPVRFSSVVSSDLARARRTAEIIAGPRASIESLAALREIDLGAWEGLTFRQIEQRFPEAYAARGRDLENWRPPGGESFATCRARVLHALAEILKLAPANLLIVAHAGVNRLILCGILGIPAANLHSMGQDYGCVNVIEYSGARARLQLLNYTPLATRPIEAIASSRELRVAQG